MWNRFVMVVGIPSLLAGCAKAVQVEAVEPEEEHYRPGWVADVALHTDGARACLDGRESPRFVAHVEPLSSGAVGFTTVDAYGEVQNCAYADGKVVRRQPSPLHASELAGLPLFAEGPSQPVVPVGVKAEEVLDGDKLVGWLFWPPGAQ